MLKLQRTCVACNKKGSKTDFIRVVKNKYHQILIDLSPQRKKSIPGRGAYLCPNTKCLAKAFNRKGKNAFSYRLQTNVDAEIRQRLENLLQ
jgi:hypothetical protein